VNNRIPEFDALVDEIAELTGADRSVVAHRVWIEALNQTSNVTDAAKDFGLQPHVYSEQMEQFYRETDAFIFETMIESFRNGKRAVLADAEARIREYQATRQSARAEVLMFGDGTGSDSSYFHHSLGEAIRLSSFDVPGSKTFEFAARSFAKHRLPVEVITEFEQIPEGKFDVVVSFEVLEHLPDPQQAIHDIARFLKPNGIALITESFDAVISCFPTHLWSNAQYAKRTPLMFAKAGLILTYVNTASRLKFRPTEYTKKVPVTRGERLGVLLNRQVSGELLKGFAGKVLRLIR
jgi:SAM-dependent methyltransferase